MAPQGFVGEYNNIYFLTEGGKISQLCDRAHRKLPVRFLEEELEDLADVARQPSQLSLSSALTSRFPERPRFSDRENNQSKEIAGRHFTVLGEPLTSWSTGFGLDLNYWIVAPATDCAAVLLTLKLPDRARYRVHWDLLRKDGERFILPSNMAVTVLSDLPWNFQKDTFTVQTGPESGEVTFLVESFFEPSRVQQVLILTAKGQERNGLLARAACGGGFVSCFVLDASQYSSPEALKPLLREIPYRFVISIGLPAAQALASHGVQVLELNEAADVQGNTERLLGQSAPKKSLLAPDIQEAYGPALFLALELGVRLKLSTEIVDRIRLEDTDGSLLQEWLLTDLLGTPLNAETTKIDVANQAKDNQELVICESTTSDLLVSQAIGYAHLKQCPIAFLGPIAERITADEFPDSTTGIRFLEATTGKVVPSSLRTPNAAVLTIFTRRLPLHLTPLLDFEAGKTTLHWIDRYTLAHLPGQTASQLVPRFFGEFAREAPATPFAVIFDALGEVIDTEGSVYAAELARGLSHPIVLPKQIARREVLREILQRLDTDFLLLITHGSENFIEDGQGDVISDREIATWNLHSSPIVFNNSCSSWTTTGRAFLSSGARAHIGTLWPVTNDLAAKIAIKIGQRLHAQEEDDLAALLMDAIGEVTAEYPNGKATAAAYIYVGLPGVQLLSRPAINTLETVALLTETYQTLYHILERIGLEGRPDLAIAIQRAVGEALRQRFKSLLVPGELPLHLSWPMSYLSILDVDFLLARANFNFGRTLLTRLPHEHQLGIVEVMDQHLSQTIFELVSWEDRHDKHAGISKEERRLQAEQSGLPNSAMSEASFVKLAAQLTLGEILPFVVLLADLLAEDRARFWLDMAAKLVTMPADLSPDGSVSDMALIQRIRQGIQQRVRIYSPQGNDSDSITSIDLLEGVINKSELANWFGIACLHLKDMDRAITFYQAARDLAEPGSEYFANASSNLSNALRQTNRYQESLTGYRQALMDQERLQDYNNAIITTSNMFRAAAQADLVIDEAIMQKAMIWAEARPLPGDRLKSQCDLLGALSCYYASRGKHQQATLTCQRISQHLNDTFPIPDVLVHLNELVEWYYTMGQFSRAADLALTNAALLNAKRLTDVAARTQIRAGASALRAYEVNYDKRFLRMFLESSKEVGRARRSNPDLLNETELRDWLAYTWKNTQSLWTQLADKQDRVLALLAYESVKAWEPDHEDPAWELLAKAYHPRNREVINSLAANGSLRRKATATVDDQMRVVVDVTTVRSDVESASGSVSLPRVVFGYLPLYNRTEPSLVGQSKAEFVAGVAAYSLAGGERVRVQEEDVDALRTDGEQTYLYERVWGSRMIRYDLSIHLAPGLIPIEMKCARLFGPALVATVRFDRSGCRIAVKTEDTTSVDAWLANVRLIFRKIPGLEPVFNDSTGLFANEMPWSLYTLTLQLLSSKGGGSQ
jgi:hypothetical protein